MKNLEKLRLLRLLSRNVAKYITAVILTHNSTAMFMDFITLLPTALDCCTSASAASLEIHLFLSVLALCC